MSRTAIAALVVFVSVGMPGCTRANPVTPAPEGPLAQFDFAALHRGADTVRPLGDATYVKARCSYTWPDDHGQGFELLVEVGHVEDSVLSDVSLATVQSDCALHAEVESPTRYYQVGGVAETLAQLRLNYACPSGQGSAALSISLVEGVTLGGSSASCVALP